MLGQELYCLYESSQIQVNGLSDNSSHQPLESSPEALAIVETSHLHSTWFNFLTHRNHER